MFINFCLGQQLKVGNSFFKAKNKNKWTWKAPENENTKWTIFLQVTQDSLER